MLFAEALAMLRRDGYMDAADIMEEQAMQIFTNRQAMLENEALKKQLKVTMEDLKTTREGSEPVIKAHWIYSPCDGVWTTACSHCGYEETGENMRKYMGCPMCRAKMTHIECIGHRKEIERRINYANGFNREAINETEEESPTV